MRKSLVLATLFVVMCSAAAFAGVPDPSRSACSVSAAPTGCQYRFNAAGGLDTLTLTVTLRDAFDSPVANCSTTVTLDNASAVVCNCCPDQLTGSTNANGIVTFNINQLGGRGSVDLNVTANCTGNIAICSNTINFTTPDLNASCDAGVSTNVIDLGVFANCLPPSPYCQESDFSCDGTVNVVDLGLLASGLTAGCGSAACP